MFDSDPKSIAEALSRMEREAREKTRFNQLEAKERMKSWLQQDRRFDAFDHDRLVERVAHCRSNGAVFDMNDPALRKEPSRNRY